MKELNILSQVGVVVIGRNEGERLGVCLRSLKSFNISVVYVDSGSTDGSVALAQSLNAQVLNLDMSQSFTAARARNTGFQRLLQITPDIEFVQFVDGDCEVVATWLNAAVQTLQGEPNLAVVCGRRKERYPNATFYNFMCDVEWNTPIGEAKACGGDALMRVKAFKEVGGYNESLIAGEEPELCVRLRQANWKIQRIDEAMTVHDAAMTTLTQWWKRSVRAGHAFAEGAYMHGKTANHWVQESHRPWFWAFMLPLTIILIAASNGLIGALLLTLIYPLQIVRQALKDKRHGKRIALRLAGFNMLSKFAELQGQLRFHFNRMLNHKTRLIEYK